MISFERDRKQRTALFDHEPAEQPGEDQEIQRLPEKQAGFLSAAGFLPKSRHRGEASAIKPRHVMRPPRLIMRLSGLRMASAILRGESFALRFETFARRYPLPARWKA